MYGCRVLEAATLYSLLDHLRQRFSEQDVALIFALLNSVGYQLRSDDPAAMKVCAGTSFSCSTVLVRQCSSATATRNVLVSALV